MLETGVCRMYLFKRAGVLTICFVAALSAQTKRPLPSQPIPSLPETLVPEVAGVGNFSHIVSNLDKSIEFYRDVLGLELTAPPAPC